MFEADDTGDIYVWLKKNAVLDAPGYLVRDRISLTTWEEGVFIREFEEQMEKAKAVTGKHKCLSEDRIRTIVREEVSKVVDALCERIGLAEDVQTMETADSLHTALEAVANNAVNAHFDECHGESQYEDCGGS